MMNFLKKILNFFSGLRTRPGFDRFVGLWQEKAVELIVELAEVNSNREFHEWKDEAFNALKSITGELKGNWIALVIGLAFEEAKSRKLIR